MLRIELAFYIGCLNLYEQLTQLGEGISFPEVAAADQRRHSFRGLSQLMMQCGMFTPAEAFSANICPCIIDPIRRCFDLDFMALVSIVQMAGIIQ
jgi:hypothetical protein